MIVVLAQCHLHLPQSIVPRSGAPNSAARWLTPRGPGNSEASSKDRMIWVTESEGESGDRRAKTAADCVIQLPGLETAKEADRAADEEYWRSRPDLRAASGPPPGRGCSARHSGAMYLRA